MEKESHSRLIEIMVGGVLMIAVGVYGLVNGVVVALLMVLFGVAALAFVYFRWEKPVDFEPSITQHRLLESERKSRGVIRTGNMPKKILQDCIDLYKADYGGDELPDSITPDGAGFVLSFENVEYGAMCSWVGLLARPDTSTQYEVKGWLTLGDLSQEPDLKDLSDQTIMLFVPIDDKDYDSVYFVAPDGKCYKQWFSDCGTLECAPHVHQRYQEAPW